MVNNSSNLKKKSEQLVEYINDHGITLDIQVLLRTGTGMWLVKAVDEIPSLILYAIYVQDRRYMTFYTLSGT